MIIEKFARLFHRQLMVLSVVIVGLGAVGVELHAYGRAKSTKVASATTPQKPRLILVLSFDQMRGDFIDRWRSFWGKKGFNRLLSQGVHFTNCLNDHASNITAPGHAILMTGHYPYKTGIVSNDMYDRVLGREQYCVEDTAHQTFGIKKPREWTSPVNLLVPTVGDMLKQVSPRSKVVGVSYKDRAAILMAGKNADAAFWFEAEAGGFTTSTYYGFSSLPEWLKNWRTNNDYTQYVGKVWNAEVSSTSYYTQDTCAWETKFPSGTTYFPHTMPQRNNKKQKDEYDKAFSVSPFAIEHQFLFARHVLQEYQLGKDEVTDILNLSISTTDYVGHAYGPDSREVFEIYMRTDKYLGEFLESIDRMVGAKNYVVVVSADHGVAPVPERSVLQGEEGGRVIELDVVTSIENYLQSKIPRASGKYVRSFVKPNLFFNEAVFASQEDVERWTDSVAQHVRSLKGIGVVATKKDLQKNIISHDVEPQVFANVQRDFFPQRSGDLLVYPRHGWVFGSVTATHGAYHSYDRHIPLVFSGYGFMAGYSTLKTASTCIAPTLAELLGIAMPSSDGYSLLKNILKKF